MERTTDGAETQQYHIFVYRGSARETNKRESVETRAQEIKIQREVFFSWVLLYLNNGPVIFCEREEIPKYADFIAERFLHCKKFSKFEGMDVQRML